MVDTGIRMIEKVLKRITKFYQVSLVCLMLATLGSVFYFWNLGFIDGSKGKELHKASFIMERFSNKNQLKEVKDLVFAENPKKAIQKIKEFENELEKVNKQAETEEFGDLKKELQVLKTKSAGLIAFSKSQKVISVFTNKLNKFYNYVKKNNWRTLTRMSDRIYSKVSGHVNKKNVGVLANNILRDFKSMIKITENSVLSRRDKSEIVSRITNLQIEMEMLKNYASKRSEFSAALTSVEGNFKAWVEKVSPEITLNKIKVEDIGRYYVIGMLGILFALSCLFFGSFLINKWFFKKAREDFENGLESYVNEGLLAGDNSKYDEFSDEFRYFSDNISSYIDKRMSFGTIFQDALPLSSILLDHNLKVVWANKQFCDDWQISEDEIKKDYMSWDYLNKLTNLGHDDPVLEALKHNIAGIYQVQIKPHDEAEVRPYEMFVSPINSKGENKIMLFFYDLTNLEATIKDQSISILNPVKHSVESLLKGQFVASEQMEYEFKIAGIEEIYEKFLALNEDIIKNENDLYDQIERSDLKIRKLKAVIESIEEKNKDNAQLNRINIEALKSFKNNVISLSSLSKTLDDLTTKTSELVNTNVNALKNSAGKVQDLKQVTGELVEALPRFHNIKDEIKQAKSVIADNRAKLSHELSQMTILMKRANDPQTLEKLSRTIAKINDNFTLLNTASDDLDKKLSALDIIMSKAQMIMNTGSQRIQEVTTEYEATQIDYSLNHLNYITKMKGNSGENLDEYETNIVQSLQKIFTANKDHIKNCDQIARLNQQASQINIEPRVSQ